MVSWNLVNLRLILKWSSLFPPKSALKGRKGIKGKKPVQKEGKKEKSKGILGKLEKKG